jgi:hypothetical protein
MVCIIGHAFLDQEASEYTHYEALNYCWGDVVDTAETVIQFPITKGSCSRAILIVTLPLHNSKS